MTLRLAREANADLQVSVLYINGVCKHIDVGKERLLSVVAEHTVRLLCMVYVHIVINL